MHNYGLTGTSCSRLLEPSVARIAFASAPFDSALSKPAGVSVLRWGVPIAATAAVNGMAAAARPREKIASCFRICGDLSVERARNVGSEVAGASDVRCQEPQIGWVADGNGRWNFTQDRLIRANFVLMPLACTEALDSSCANWGESAPWPSVVFDLCFRFPPSL